MFGGLNSLLFTLQNVLGLGTVRGRALLKGQKYLTESPLVIRILIMILSAGILR